MRFLVKLDKSFLNLIQKSSYTKRRQEFLKKKKKKKKKKARRGIMFYQNLQPIIQTVQ